MNATGHMLIARIAWDKMTPNTRKAVESLTSDPANPKTHRDTTGIDNDVLTAATWMDDIKPLMRSSHYTALPLDGDGHIPDGENSVNRVKAEIKLLSDPKAGKNEKAEALRITMHLVGDIHQPLHDADNDGDAGGNGFSLEGQHNLHELWDSGGNQWKHLSRPLPTEDRTALTKMASDVENRFSEESMRFRAGDLQPEDWAHEGLNIARSEVYTGVHANHPASKAYVEKVQTMMDRQVALGGYRLANVLNGIFDHR